MPYKNLSIFYLSGTGNALKAALKIEEKALSLNIHTNIISVDRQKRVEEEIVFCSSIIGFCYPTHGFSLPWHMLRFIFSMPKSKGTHFFLLNTRAGSKLFKLYFPGISGIAIWLPLLILWLKGYQCKGLFPLDMPSNWISLHPGFNKKTVRSITSRCRALTENFAIKILNRKTHYRLNTFLFIPIDFFLIPISLAYMLAGRFFLSKTFIADYKCNNCGLCLKSCPTKAIKLKFGRPYWTTQCESCMRCMNICPQRAIQTAHGYIVLIIALLFYIPFLSIINNQLATLLNTGISSFDAIINITVFTIIVLPFMCISYYLLMFLQKYKLSSYLFRFTSLTNYWRHYIAEDINSDSFKKGRTF